MPTKLTLLFILAFSLPCKAEPFVIAADYSKNIPPLFWLDPCTQEKKGFGWLMQQRLWQDLNIETQAFQFDVNGNESLNGLSELMKAKKVDVFLTVPPMKNDIFTTTEHPFFWLANSVYQRKDSQWQYQQWQDLKGFRGVMIVPFMEYDRRSTAFKNFSDQFLDLQLAVSYPDSFKKLSDGEIDYVITYRLIGSGFIEVNQLNALKSAPIENIANPTHLAIANNSALQKRIKDIDRLLSNYHHGSVAELLLKSSLKSWVAMINRSDKCLAMPATQKVPTPEI